MNKNKKIIAGVVAAIVVIAVGVGAWEWYENSPKTPDITENEAQQIALKDAGLTVDNATVTVTYDNEDNEYDVDVYSIDGTQAYEYTISGKNGDIRDKEVTTRSMPQSQNQSVQNNQPQQNAVNQNSGNKTIDEAKNIALKDSGFSASEVQFVKQQMDSEKNEYDIEFIATDANDGKQYKYEYDIHASSGNIVNKSKDLDLY